MFGVLHYEAFGNLYSEFLGRQSTVFQRAFYVINHVVPQQFPARQVDTDKHVLTGSSIESLKILTGPCYRKQTQLVDHA